MKEILSRQNEIIMIFACWSKTFNFWTDWTQCTEISRHLSESNAWNKTEKSYFSCGGVFNLDGLIKVNQEMIKAERLNSYRAFKSSQLTSKLRDQLHKLILTTELHQPTSSVMLICQHVVADHPFPPIPTRSVAVLQSLQWSLMTSEPARRVGKTLPSGNVGNQDLCSSSSFIFTKRINSMNSSWMQAKELTHLLHAFVVGILFEMFAQRDAEKHDRPRRRLRRLKKTKFIAVSFFICLTSVKLKCIKPQLPWGTDMI